MSDLPYWPPLKSAHSCRICRRWLEGEWPAASPEEKIELQRQMDVGRCDDCTRKMVSSSKITREEAEAFRARVKKQNEEFLKNWVIIPIDDAIEMLEQVAMALLEKSGEEAP